MDNQNLNYSQILAALRKKRESIDEAILTIERLEREERGGHRENPAAWLAQATNPQRGGQRTATPRKRMLTPEGRERIAEADRKRWAAKRAAGATKKGTKKAASKKKRA